MIIIIIIIIINCIIVCSIYVHVTFTVVGTHIKLFITHLFVLVCLGEDIPIL